MTTACCGICREPLVDTAEPLFECARCHQQVHYLCAARQHHAACIYCREPYRGALQQFISEHAAARTVQNHASYRRAVEHLALLSEQLRPYRSAP